MYGLMLMALAAGVSLAVQAAINSRLAHGLNNQPLMAATVSFAVGTVLLLLLCWWKADWTAVAQMPKQAWWRYSGGILGVGFVFTTILLAPRLGISNMLFLIIVGQLAAAAVIDHFGLIGMTVRPFSLWQGVGLLTVLAGLVLFFFGKRLFG